MEQFVQSFDHHTIFFRDHFYNVLKRVAGEESLLRSNVYDGGFSVVTSYELMTKICFDTENFSNAPGSRVVPRSTMPLLMPSDLDPPVHGAFRKLLNQYFTPKSIAAFTEVVGADIREILAAALHKGELDIVTDLGQPVTGKFTMRLLGLPVEDWAEYSMPIHRAAFCIGPVEQRIAGGMAFAVRVRSEIERLAKLADAPGLIPILLSSSVDGRKLTIDEIQAIVMNLIIGGLDTTQAVIGCTSVFLARNPDRRAELARHPERISGAVTEFLRIFGSAPMTGRDVVRDCEVDGHAFRAGHPVLLFWTAASFDPAFVKQPFDVDFTRGANRMGTFAFGPHHCLGNQFARMELGQMLKAIVELDRFDVIEERLRIADNVSSTLAFLEVPVGI
ncbi:cytochrome P450 [Rhizorhabdus argentea]|uniref:cytochrome P450 n=1 Tax=Rhizorhabdus argentea TaxID=1387174 RepID=UPI0030EE3048